MSLLRRRAVLAGLGALPFAALQAQTVAFDRGDVLVGCTLLNDPADDHRGRGRILHYDANLRLRNTLWIEDTTHIVQGLRFAPGGVLWAFDAFAYKVLRFDRGGRRLSDFKAPARSFAHVTFAPDGRFFLGENFVGTGSKVPLRTTLPFMPGTRRLGDGHLFEFSSTGRLLRQHRTPVHGGMGGFQGLTASALAADGKTLFYTSESGPRIMRWDVAAQRSLPDLVDASQASGRFFFDLAFDAAGRLLVVTGLGVEALDATTGAVLQRYPLGSFGWASMSPPASDTVYLSNFFSGEIARLDLQRGSITARADTGTKKSASGVAVAPG
ncbi:MAG: SMP-30/gluconolactonase/LRE family protein [Steroidobacteraceae bacterium]